MIKVPALMLHLIATRCKSSGTISTLEWLLARVRPHMQLEVGDAAELTATYRLSKLFLVALTLLIRNDIRQ